jgi:hypothetical protein
MSISNWHQHYDYQNETKDKSTRIIKYTTSSPSIQKESCITQIINLNNTNYRHCKTRYV